MLYRTGKFMSNARSTKGAILAHTQRTVKKQPSTRRWGWTLDHTNRNGEYDTTATGYLVSMATAAEFTYNNSPTHTTHITATTMANPVTIPDLRYEETFKTKLVLAARQANERKRKQLQQKQQKEHQDVSIVHSADAAADAPVSDKHLASDIPVYILVKAILIDQILLPFAQSFLMASALFYLRPLLTASTMFGYRAGTSIVRTIRKLFKSVFFLNDTNMNMN